MPLPVSLCLILVAAGIAPGGPPSAVIVRSDSDCPSSSSVRDALAGLLARPEPGEALDVLELRRDGGALEVRLTEAAGRLIASRRLIEGKACGERAQMVAVLVAAWETRLRAGQQATLPHVPPPAPPAIGARTSAFARPLGPAPALVGVRDEAPPIAPRLLELETRAGLIMSIADGTIASGATCDVSVSREGSQFAVAAGVIAVGAHATAVLPGSASWRRLGGVVDLRSMLRWNAFDLEMHGGVALTALSVSGESLPVTGGATLFDPGLLIGLRARVRSGRVSPWVEATVAFWPLTHTVYVDGTASSHQLPSFEALLGVGASFGTHP
jgi:hypothetical protein